MNFDNFDKFFGVFFIVVALSSLVMSGVIVWAIVQLVQHFTAS